MLPNTLSAKPERTSLQQVLTSVAQRMRETDTDLSIKFETAGIWLRGPFKALEVTFSALVRAVSKPKMGSGRVVIDSANSLGQTGPSSLHLAISAGTASKITVIGHNCQSDYPFGSWEQGHNLEALAAIGYIRRIGGIADIRLGVRGELCFSLELLLDRDDRYRANVQDAEGIMQEPANYTNGENFERSGLELAPGPQDSGSMQSNESGPLTMRSEASTTSNLAGPTRVLICDDESRLVTLTAGLLREFGYEVLTVKSGEEAISCVSRETVDVVILDVNLPGEDTLSVARRLIENNAPAIVLSSGFTEEDVESELLSLPAVRAFLAKPYGIDALSATIRQVVAKKYQNE